MWVATGEQWNEGREDGKKNTNDGYDGGHLCLTF